MKKTIAAAALTAAALTVGAGAAIVTAGPAFGWHATLSADSACVDDQSVATFTLTEPGEDWNGQHADAVVTASSSSLFPVGTHVAYAAELEKTSPIDEATTVSISLGWVGSGDTWSGAATAYPVEDCSPPETTTTTSPPETTTTTAPPASTTTTTTPPSTAPPATIEPPEISTVVVEPAFTG